MLSEAVCSTQCGSMLQSSRLESQARRYKTASEEAEKLNEELKVEKRKLQRDVS